MKKSFFSVLFDKIFELIEMLIGGRKKSLENNVEVSKELNLSEKDKTVLESKAANKAENKIVIPQTLKMVEKSETVSHQKEISDEEIIIVPGIVENSEQEKKADIIVEKVEPLSSENNSTTDKSSDKNILACADDRVNNGKQESLPDEIKANDSSILAKVKEVKHDIKKKMHEINTKYDESIEAIDAWEKQRMKEIKEEEKEIERLTDDSLEDEDVIDITPKEEPKNIKTDVKNDPVIQKTKDLTNKFEMLLKQKGIK